MLSSPVYAKLHPRQPIPHARLSSISFRRSQRSNVQTFQPFNDPRPNAIQSPSKACRPRPLPSRQHRAPLSPLPATLMDHPASVANKRLTENLTPLDATLTKNRGRGAPYLSLRSTKLQPPLCFHLLTNCPFSIPFVLTFIHVMGGVYPPRPTMELSASVAPCQSPFPLRSKHSNVQTCQRSSPCRPPRGVVHFGPS
jgi:hypothetical protein